MNHGKLKTEGREDWQGGLNHMVNTKFKAEEAALTFVAKRNLLVVFETANNMN